MSMVTALFLAHNPFAISGTICAFSAHDVYKELDTVHLSNMDTDVGDLIHQINGLWGQFKRSFDAKDYPGADYYGSVYYVGVLYLQTVMNSDPKFNSFKFKVFETSSREYLESKSKSRSRSVDLDNCI